MRSGGSDPAEWSRASETPDVGGNLDTLQDFLLEAATARLSHLPAKDRKSVAIAVANVAYDAIQEAKEKGLLHDTETSIWTPQFREALAHIFAELLDSSNPRLLAQCFDFAMGFGLQMGVSEQDIADQHAPMTRSNVSKMCVQIRKRYQVPPSRGMRSIPTCQNYSNRQKGRRAKPTPEAWKGLSVLQRAYANAA